MGTYHHHNRALVITARSGKVLEYRHGSAKLKSNQAAGERHPVTRLDVLQPGRHT
jgi:hypothetical protein